MITTTYTGTGVNGQAARIQLAQVGEIIVITTGSTKFRTYREVTARVTDHTFRTITGTNYGVWETVAETATGETITDRRVRPATETEAADFTAATEAEAEVPTKLTSDEAAAYTAHRATCLDCNPGFGKTCPEGMKLWNARHEAGHWTKAPINTTDRWGVTKGYWDMEVALAHVAINGGRVTKAPEGMVEATLRKQANARIARRAARAARR